jgi:hypothetical protein
MKKRLMFVIVGVRSLRFALCLSVIMLVASEGRADELIINDFEGPNPVDGVTVTPAAVSEGSTVTAVSDVPDGGGSFAAKTALDADAGADGWFSTAFPFATLDLSAATEITFWIKTDIASNFNFQIHSGDAEASVFGFSTAEFTPDTWNQITAPVASFTKPPWSPNPLVWSNVIRFQITAFGSGPYDGLYAIIDNVIADAAVALPSSIITSFAASVLTPFSGEDVTFSWIVDPDATVSIDQGIGSVDAQTIDGIGELQITAPDVPAGTALDYTLTVSKEGEKATRTLTLTLARKPVDKLFVDFEGPNGLGGAFVSHAATLTLVSDVPDGGGSFAAKTVLDADAGADGYFSTAFPLAALQDLTDALEISFWIKTDIVSNFNLQVHSVDGAASVFGFSTAEFTPDTWNQITAPVVSFTKPAWSSGPVDWKNVIRFQITPFGSGPYDGKYTIIDNAIVDDGPDVEVEPFKITSGIVDASGFSLSWESRIGNIYQVQRQATLDAPWQTIADAYPEGGATADNTSFTDTKLGASAIYRVAQLAAPPLFFDDFESGAPGWATSDLGESGTEWELGKPTNGPGEAHSPTRAYGTGLAKDYDDYTEVYLVSPVIDLTGLDNARLEFWSYRDCEPWYLEFGQKEFLDWCQIMILNEDDEYIVDDPIWIRGGEAKEWRLEKVKIPVEALGQKIKLEFSFISDGAQENGPQAGWFIDDVAVTSKR